MARRLFFVPEVRNGMAAIRGDDAKHLTRVLRVEPGQVYQISDNRSLYLAEVEEAHKGLVSFRVQEKLAIPESGPDITLAASLIKFDHFEWMIEKATELGVSRIVPVIATRSERGLDRAAAKRIERWRKIALEASQQCRRPVLPEIADAAPFEDVLALSADVRLFADEDGGVSVFAALASQTGSVAVMIGPEGGWTDHERQLTAAWTRVMLGPHVLRAETAAIAALASVVTRLLS